MFKNEKIGFKLKGYVNFDFAGNSNNRKSIAAYFYIINNTCIS